MLLNYLRNCERIALLTSLEMQAFICLIILTLSISYGYSKRMQSPPRIIKGPPANELFLPNIEEVQGKYFYLECEADGQPDPRYYWKRNGGKFEWQQTKHISMQPGRGTLSFTSVDKSDVGQYQCVAENHLGIASSNSVFVREAEFNSFGSASYISLIGNENEPFKLECVQPYGVPKPVIYWVKRYADGTLKSIQNPRVSVDPEGNLWFSSLKPEDASAGRFTYTCTAVSFARSEYKMGNSYLLNVAAATSEDSNREPILQYVTKNEVALRGTSVELFCIFGGSPQPVITWLKDGQHIINAGIIQEKFLKLNSVDFEDEAVYTCEVRNDVGEPKYHSINLTVLAIPYFIQEPELIIAADGETVKINCLVHSVPAPDLQWTYNGKPIQQITTNSRRKIGPNSIEIERVTEDDIGIYGCNASNFLGYVYKEGYVNVLARPPEIIRESGNVTTVEGKNVNLTCAVFGVPNPVVQWSRNSQKLQDPKYVTSYNSFSKTHNLVIENVRIQDAGIYKCQAVNKHGSSFAVMDLTVTERSEITIGPENMQTLPGTAAMFQCHAVSDSRLSIVKSWLYNGQPVNFANTRIMKSPDLSYITISQLVIEDSGVYTCVVKTSIDEVQASATLTVQNNFANQ